MKHEREMHCDEVELVLDLWGDGELDEARGELVRTHLLECPACREEYRERRNLRRWIERPEVPAVPEGFGRRVAAQAARLAAARGAAPLVLSDERAGARVAVLRPVPATLAPVPTGGGGREGSVLPFVLACTAAAAALLLVLSIAIGAQGRPSGEELRAEPLPQVLRALEELKAQDGQAAPGADRGRSDGR